VPVPSPAVELYLVRHAHAGDPARWTGPDERRPLSAKGRLQGQRLGRHLSALQLDLAVIVTSPRVRARETADLIAQALGMSVQVDDRLSGAFTLAALEQILADAGNPPSAMVVGHDPDFTEIAADLAGASSLPMRKGALARFDCSRPIRPGGAILRWLLPPDAIPEAGAD
jgi:phosphohistidine phosphatase